MSADPEVVRFLERMRRDERAQGINPRLWIYMQIANCRRRREEQQAARRERALT
jgi:hypothetical protein